MKAFFDEKLHASWIHLHLPSSPEVAKNFIDATQISFSKHS
jgi:cobyrinic acid a,c-diamide synthase